MDIFWHFTAGARFAMEVPFAVCFFREDTRLLCLRMYCSSGASLSLP